jgi:adenylate cyclase
MKQAERRLAAIMFTDMVGYTTLAQRNESLSLQLVEEQRGLVRPVLKRHGGREVKTIGDAFLVEFVSALEALRCATEIQEAIARRNGSSNRDVTMIQVRIGIHVGEVIEDGGDVLGDAVNIAARIEPLADPGGISVSKQVVDAIGNKLDVTVVKMSHVDLKNVKTPIEIYKVLPPRSLEGAKQMSASLRKRVAVLPFDNFSPNSGDEYFADGLTEELIGTLSKIRELSVISRTSVMQYKGRPKQMSEIGKELNAGTILEGSVRKAGDRARVSIQMIDATQDKHVWAESYDRELRDIFAVQSDIAEKVAQALKVELLAEERDVIGEAPTKSPEANLLFLKGIHEADNGSPSDVMRGIEYFELAVKRDPEFALCYAILSAHYVGIAGEAMAAGEAFTKARRNLERALELKPKLAEAHNAKGWFAFQHDWDWDEAERSFEMALELNPSLAYAHDWYGRMLSSLGRFDDAISQMRQAYELDPASPWIMVRFALVNWMAGKNDDARMMFSKALEENPRFARARLGLGFVSAIEGKKDDAIGHADEAVGIASEAYFVAQRALVHAWVDSGKAREILEDLHAGRYKGYAAPGWLAHIHYALGDKDEGYELARRSHDERDPTIPWSNKWPILVRARDDPRYMALLHEMRLP